MRTRTSIGAALFAVLGTAVVATGAAGAGSEAAPTTTVPAPPPTCTCPPATTAAPASSAVPTTAAAAPTTAAAGATSAVPTTAAGAATTVAGTTAPAGAGLPANATLDQLVAAIQPMFGPTTDSMAEFAIFGVTPPTGVPTPAGAEVLEFQMQFDDLADDEPFYYGVLLLTSTQPAADMVTLYQTELVAAGFTQTGDSVENTDSGRQIRWLEYDIPGATHYMSEFSVGIVDDDVDFVQIQWYDGLDAAAADSARTAFTSWTSLPLVDQAELIEDANISNYISGERLQIDTGYRVPGLATDVEAQFLAGLAGGPYTVDPEFSEPGRYATLDGGGFDDLTVHFTEGYVENTTTLNVNSYVVL
jgi:hypothetical protein